MIRYDVKNNIAEILFDNPPVNALSEQMLDDYFLALERADQDPNVRAVIVASAVPGRFCAGLNLIAIHEGDQAKVRHLLERLYIRNVDTQFKMSKPTIAAIDGTARGGGMTLAVSCDMIVASETADFGYPEIDAGVPPSIHYTHLPRIAGRHKAFELLFTGRTFGTAEAAEIGLIARVAPAGEALNVARELTGVIAAKSPEVVRHGRLAFVQANDNGYRAAVHAAADSFCVAASRPSAKEGIAAFVEKRKPNWVTER
jgi:enoyl-CoA hydratase